MPKQKKSLSKFKVVLDTNVWISALFWHGTPRKILDRYIEGLITVYFSEATWQEWQIKVGRLAMVFDRVKEWKRLSQLIKKRSNFVSSTTTVNICRDPEDSKFLELAATVKADYLISGDKDLTSLKQYQKTKIVTPKEFIEFLK